MNASFFWVILISVIAMSWAGYVGWQLSSDRYQRYREDFVRQNRARFERLFMPEQLAATLVPVKWLLCFALAMLMLFFLRNTPVAVRICGMLLGGVAGFFLPDLTPVYLRWKRLRRLEEQIPDTLVTMSSCVSSGLGFVQAMQFVVNQVPPPISQEFGLAIKETQVGVSISQALENMYKRAPLQDLRIFVTAVSISMEVGGNLTELFDNLAETIRDRMTMEGKIRAMTAQGKMQTLVVGILPFALAFAINFMHPELMKNLTGTGIGWALIAAACIWEVIGLFMIYKIVNIEV